MGNSRNHLNDTTRNSHGRKRGTRRSLRKSEDQSSSSSTDVPLSPDLASTREDIKGHSEGEYNYTYSSTISSDNHHHTSDNNNNNWTSNKESIYRDGNLWKEPWIENGYRHPSSTPLQCCSSGNQFYSYSILIH